METHNRPVKGFLRLEDFGLDPMTVSRWRKRLKDPEKFDEALKRAGDRGAVCVPLAVSPAFENRGPSVRISPGGPGANASPEISPEYFLGKAIERGDGRWSMEL